MVDQSLLAGVPGPDRSFGGFLDSLPDLLAARDLRTVITAVAAAARNRRGVVLLLGGHVVKVGLGPLLGELIRRRVVTHVAMNGATAIHDWELAVCGETSEDVAAGLADGTFGMVEETGTAMNAAIDAAAAREQGLGEGLADAIARQPELPGRRASLLIACQESGVPVTVHAADRRRNDSPAPEQRRRRPGRHLPPRLPPTGRQPAGSRRRRAVSLTSAAR